MAGASPFDCHRTEEVKDMHKRLLILAILLAASLPAAAREEQSLEQLIARADSARLEDRPGLYTEIARRQVDAADESFREGKVEQGRDAVHEVVTYSDKAGAAALQSGKKMKDTEIAMRKMAGRLRDLKRGLVFDEQAPVQAAIDHLEQIRTELLNRMFAKKGRK